MSSLFSSWKKPALLATNEPHYALPPHEEERLTELIRLINPHLPFPPPSHQTQETVHDSMIAQILRNNDCKRHVLLKYLRARGLDVKNAYEMFVNCLKWRRAEGVERKRLEMLYRESAGIPINIITSTTSSNNNNGQNGVGGDNDDDDDGIDKDVLVYAAMKYHLKSKLNVKEYYEAVIASLEHLFYRKKGLKANQLVIIIDFSEWSPIQNVELSILKESIMIVFNNYPERLKNVYLINYPLSLYGIYKIIEPLMDIRTRNRIEFVKSGVGLGQKLETFFGRGSLPKWLGGVREDIGCDLTFRKVDEAEMRIKFCPN